MRTKYRFIHNFFLGKFVIILCFVMNSQKLLNCMNFDKQKVNNAFSRINVISDKFENLYKNNKISRNSVTSEMIKSLNSEKNSLVRNWIYRKILFNASANFFYKFLQKRICFETNGTSLLLYFYVNSMSVKTLNRAETHFMLYALMKQYHPLHRKLLYYMLWDFDNLKKVSASCFELYKKLIVETISEGECSKHLMFELFKRVKYFKIESAIPQLLKILDNDVYDPVVLGEAIIALGTIGNMEHIRFIGKYLSDERKGTILQGGDDFHVIIISIAAQNAINRIKSRWKK